MSLVDVVEGVVAIDGKTVRGSQDGPNTALYMISACATASGLCLAQEGVRGKGKEIEGIEAFLETPTLKGGIVTMEALGCQTEIAQKILERGGCQDPPDHKPARIGCYLIPPRHPQTNGMVERMSGRIQELLQQTRFASVKELETTLMRYLAAYNHHIPQRALAHRTPVQAIEEWKLKKPGSIRFVPVYDQAGFDTRIAGK
jgi:hypothetical protein